MSNRIDRGGQVSPGAAVGVTEAMVSVLVRTFYSRVQEDELLGPIFAKAIPGNWEPHLTLLTDFWCSVTLMSGTYHGRPLPVHARLDGLTLAHFERWMALFTTTAQEVCPPQAAALFIDRAHRIADSFKIGLDSVGRLAS